ncbi:hypothetical protein OB966_27000, partial [Bacillus cereus]|nr:hypothetical protein [Bacillus cereus]
LIKIMKKELHHKVLVNQKALFWLSLKGTFLFDCIVAAFSLCILASLIIRCSAILLKKNCNKIMGK